MKRVFAWYAERLLRKRFASVRCDPGLAQVVGSLGRHGRPALIALSHGAWWDPIVAAFLWRRWFPQRSVYAPMDANELARFRFMKKLGMFGIAPDDPRSLPRMLAYLEKVTKNVHAPTIMITPEGRFTDPREPLSLRPGAAAVASRLAITDVVVVNIEYAFWNDQRPEVFIRAVSVPAPSAERATASMGNLWQEALVRAMTTNRETLAAMVMERDPAAFVDAFSSAGRVHPMYDLWLRLTGRRGSIETEHRRKTDGASSRTASPQIGRRMERSSTIAREGEAAL